MLKLAYQRLMRWAFARFYREFAFTYDTVAALVSRGLWPRWIEAAKPVLHGRYVLELGCGTGYLQRALAQSYIPAVGLDASPYMLALSRYKVERSGAVAHLVHAYAQRLPFVNETFSDVVATFPAEYILDPVTYAEAWRVLTPNGRLVLIDAAQLTHRDLYSAAVDAAYIATLQTRQIDPRPALMREAGFDVHETWAVVGNSRVQVLWGARGMNGKC
jgi:ubiquinone/menaquinone biosynthesis C-methylase UbiE